MVTFYLRQFVVLTFFKLQGCKSMAIFFGFSSMAVFYGKLWDWIERTVKKYLNLFKRWFEKLILLVLAFIISWSSQTVI